MSWLRTSEKRIAPITVASYSQRAGQFYDACHLKPDDLAFYRRHLVPGKTRVLELGCGTGRVTAALAAHAGRIVGVDNMPAWLSLAAAKLAAVSPDRWQLVEADMSRLDLGERFDLVIAPFRAFQQLETNEQIEAFFDVVRRHLIPGGRCILNVFNPKAEAYALAAGVLLGAEEFCWEKPFEQGVLYHSHVADELWLEPYARMKVRLLFRYFERAQAPEQVEIEGVLRLYQPHEFLRLPKRFRFEVDGSYGGYHRERYGAGEELIVRFG